MTDNDLENIYEYMGLKYIPTKSDWSLDSNAASECANEMERKGDWDEFSIYVTNFFEFESIADMPHFLLWFGNPTNFFTCFAKWLKERKHD